MAKETFSKRLEKPLVIHRLLVCIALAFLSCALPGRAAEPYPTRPVRLIVPYSPGGNADILGRYMAKRLSDVLGERVIVDNRPGGNSIIGTELAARAPADGYTMILVASSFATNPSIARLPYDTLKDLAPISLVGSTPLLLVAHPGVPASSVQQLIALAKRRPGQLNFASSGNGSPANLAGALFNIMAGIDIVHVAYKGTSGAITDTMAGYVQLAYPSMTSVLPQVKSGKLKALAITSPQRSSLGPDLPTVSEAGLPGYQASIWNGLLVPSGTPKAIIMHLNQAVVQVLKSTEARDWYATLGADALYGSPAEFDAFIQSEMIKWSKVIQESGIRVNLNQ